MRLQPFMTLVGLALFGVGGFFTGRVTSPGRDRDALPEANTTRPTSRVSGAAAGDREASRTSRSERSGAGNNQDRLKRLEAIVRGENALDRNRALLAFIDQLAPSDFEKAVSHFRALGLNDSRNGEFALLLTAWAKVDPLAAITYAREKTNGGFATNTILSSWATADPEAAIQWAKSHHEGEEGNPFFAGIIRGLAGSDPSRATELLTSMPRGNQRGEALQALVPHILKDGPDAARLWVANIGDPILRDGLMDRMAEPMAEIDPEGTANWLLANPGDGAVRRMEDVFELWADKDQQAALASLDRLPSGDYRSNALQGVIGSVAKNNPQAAVAMMERFPGDVTDEVVQTMVWDSFRNDPATAASQIFRIADEGQRDQMYRRALGRWLERDPGGAQAWLRKNPVSENVQNHLARQQLERQ